MTSVWQHLHGLLSENQTAVLMVVIESEGSAPGKRGFKMSIAPDGSLCGTIGGGIMEHKLIEQARSRMKTGQNWNEECRQVHHRKAPPDQQSGMICAGSQTIAVRTLDSRDLITINDLIEAQQGAASGYLILESDGLVFAEMDLESDAVYTEFLGPGDRVHIIGGGHVGLALSKVLELLDFRVFVYDHREDVATMQAVACSKAITEYHQLGDLIPSGPREYAVIVTTGYGSDAEALYRLIDKDLAYVGLMGSAAKIKAIFDELRALGVPNERLKQVRAPIGVRIRNRTPTEIAISIAAELVDERNRRLES